MLHEPNSFTPPMLLRPLVVAILALSLAGCTAATPLDPRLAEREQVLAGLPSEGSEGLPLAISKDQILQDPDSWSFRDHTGTSYQFMRVSFDIDPLTGLTVWKGVTTNGDLVTLYSSERSLGGNLMIDNTPFYFHDSITGTTLYRGPTTHVREVTPWN